jgi:hypothetical protein
MNPYYATGFMTALALWVWPVFLFRVSDAHWAVVAFFSLLLFIGAGRAASELHIRFIAPKAPPRGPGPLIGLTCAAIVAFGLLTRAGYYLYTRG